MPERDPHPEEDVRDAAPEQVGEDDQGDTRSPARETAARQARDEGEIRGGEDTATGNPGAAGAGAGE